MLQWIARWHDVITALTGIGTLLVWVLYLQVFLRSYRRELRANILITRGVGDGLDARCFISNMSAGPVYVQSIIVTLEIGGERLVCPVTDLLDLEMDCPEPPDLRLKTRQGPLSTGDLKDIGAFRSLIHHVLREKRGRGAAADLNGLGTIEIEVLGVYRSEQPMIGAKRKFRIIAGDGGIRVQGETLTTEQIRSRRNRKKLIAALKQDP
jgi:hypothetical protein